MADDINEARWRKTTLKPYVPPNLGGQSFSAEERAALALEYIAGQLFNISSKLDGLLSREKP